MKKLITIIFCMLLFDSFGQTRIYEFTTIDKTTEEGWVTSSCGGEIQFDDNNLIIITEDSVCQFKITSKSYWVTDSSIMLGCLDWNDKALIVRLVTNSERMNSDWIDCYLHCPDDNLDVKMYRFCLTKCKN